MSGFDVRVEVRGLAELERKLKQVPYGTRKEAVQAATVYLIGDDTHGLKHYPPPKGQKYKRTGRLKAGWNKTASEYNPVIRNQVPYAAAVPVVWGSGGWINYGWRMWMDVIQSNMKGAIRSAQAAVSKKLRAIGL